jgi:nicotinamidase-related amidase
MSEVTRAFMRKPLAIPADRSALLCIDLQEEHRKDQRLLAAGFDGVIANVRLLQDAARANAIPLYHFAYVVDVNASLPHHPKLADGRSAFSDKDDPLTAVCPEVAPMDGERLVVGGQCFRRRPGR